MHLNFILAPLGAWTLCGSKGSSFTKIYILFYVNAVKVIPAIIYDLLTPVASGRRGIAIIIAIRPPHWIMGAKLAHLA